jgi:hypothetical protein
VDSLWSLRDANRAAAYVSRDVAMDLHGQRVSSRLRIVCGREERSDIPRGYSRARPLQFVTNRITRTTAGQGRVSAVCVKSNATEHSLSPGVKIRQQHVAGRKRRYVCVVQRSGLRPACPHLSQAAHLLRPSASLRPLEQSIERRQLLVVLVVLMGTSKGWESWERRGTFRGLRGCRGAT